MRLNLMSTLQDIHHVISETGTEDSNTIIPYSMG